MLPRTITIPLLFIFTLPVFLFCSGGSYAGEFLAPTPSDYEGPFYPVARQQDEDNDLIHVAGRTERAKGDILHLSGHVVDTAGNPVENAVVEIWQTDPDGLYKDPRDRSRGERDPNFQYWGKNETGADGSYSFITLVPGRYAPRPAHIHYKVWVDGRNVLTSQIYFSNHPDAKGDGAGPSTKPVQTVTLQKTPSGAFEASFRIVI